MALIIEHGGGGTPEQAMGEALAGFSQGFQQGQLIKAEEDRRKAAEKRAQALHKVSLEKQKMANEAASQQLDYLPERLRLEQEAADQENKKRGIAIEKAGVERDIINATKDDTIEGIKQGVELGSLKVREAKIKLREVKKAVRLNKTIDKESRQALNHRLAALANMDGAEGVLTIQRIEALSGLATTEGGAAAYEREITQIEAEITKNQQAKQLQAAQDTINDYLVRSNNAAQDETGESLDADVLPDPAVLEMLEGRLKVGESPSVVLKEVQGLLDEKRSMRLHQKKYSRSVEDIQALLNQKRQEMLADPTDSSFKSNPMKEALERAEEMLEKMIEGGAKTWSREREELIFSVLDPEGSEQRRGAYNSGFSSAAQEFSQKYEEREDYWQEKFEVQAEEIEELKAMIQGQGGGSAGVAPRPGRNPMYAPGDAPSEREGGPSLYADGKTPKAQPHLKALQDLGDEPSEEDVQEAMLTAVRGEVKSLGTRAVKMSPDQLEEHVVRVLRPQGVSLTANQVRELLDKISAEEEGKEESTQRETQRGSEMRMGQNL